MSGDGWKDYRDTKNKADILRFLRANGWEIRRDTFYRHCKTGKLNKNRSGVYTLRGVKKYAETWLVRTDTGKTVNQEGNELLTRKTEKEIERIDTVTQRERFRLDVDRGKYILRSDVESELAGRAIVLDNGLTYLIQSSAAEIIALVGGDQTRSGELVAFLNEKKDLLMNKYATMSEFFVRAGD